MKHFYRHSVLFLIILASCDVFNDEGPKPDQIFLKYFGDQNSHELFDLIHDQETGEIIMMGSKKVAGDIRGADFYLIRTDRAGNLLDDQALDVDSTEDIGSHIYLIDNGGQKELLLVGHIADLNAALIPQRKRLYWARLNLDFEILFERIIRPEDLVADASSLNQSEELIGTDILLTMNDSVIVVGHSDVQSDFNDTKANAGRQYLVHKSSLDGSTSWTKTFGYQNSDETAVGVLQDENSEIIVVGSASNVIRDGFAGTNIFITRFNRELTSGEADEIYGLSDGTNTDYDDLPASVYRKSSSSQIISVVGTSTRGTDAYPFILSVSSSGNLLISELLREQFEELNATASDVTRSLANEHIIVGSFLNFNTGTGSESVEGGLEKGEEMMFYKPGVVRNFGTQNGNERASVIESLGDGSLLIGGTADFGSGVSLFTLMKVNQNGTLEDD